MSRYLVMPSPSQAGTGIVTSGLVGHWDAGNQQSNTLSGTTWFDLTGNSNALLINGPTRSSDNGGSFSFDGTNDYVGIASANSLYSWTPSGATSNNITIELWCNTTDGASDTGFLLSKAWNDSGQYNYRLAADQFNLNIDFLNAGATGFGLNHYVASFPSIASGKWECVALVISSTSFTMYRNGSLYYATESHGVTANVPSAGNANRALVLMSLFPYNYPNSGWGGNSAFSISGKCAVTRFYNRALSAGEVTQNYNATRGRFERDSSALAATQPPTSGLVGYWDAGNSASYAGSGTTWTDLSGNSRTGTLTNGPTFSADRGGKFVMNGTSQYVSVTGTATLTEATFIAWVRRNGAQISYTGLMFSRGTNNTGMGLFGTSNTIGYHWNDTADSYNWNSGLTLPDGQWCMAALAVGASSAVAYLGTSSGISSATNTVAHTSTTLNALRLGHDNGGPANRYWKGDASVFQLYNRALTSAEITQVFNAFRGRFGI